MSSVSSSGGVLVYNRTAISALAHTLDISLCSVNCVLSVVAFAAAMFLYIGRRGWQLFILPSLPNNDKRRKMVMVLLLVNFLSVYAVFNLALAIVALTRYVVDRDDLWPILFNVEAALGYFAGACSCFFAVCLTLLWLNVATVWFSLAEKEVEAKVQRTRTFIFVSLLLVGAVAFLICVVMGIITIPPRSISTSLQKAQDFGFVFLIPFVFLAGLIQIIYALVIGVHTAKAIQKSQNSRQRVMVIKIFIALLCSFLAILIRAVGIVLFPIFGYTNYWIAVLPLRGIPDVISCISYAVILSPIHLLVCCSTTPEAGSRKWLLQELIAEPILFPASDSPINKQSTANSISSMELTTTPESAPTPSSTLPSPSSEATPVN